METKPPPSIEKIKDRSTGLLIFGILQIIIGAMCALFVPMMVMAQFAATQATGTQPKIGAMFPAIVMYLLLAVAFIWLGIGSTKARRWARALTLILARFWLLGGIVGTAMTAFMMSQMLANMEKTQSMPQPAMWVAIFVSITMVVVGFILLPGLLVWFYRSPHVKATCEVRDPVERWTDCVPLPVLALALLAGYGAFASITMPLGGTAILPLFGKILGGWQASVAMVTLGAVWAYAAWGVYKVKTVAWWIILIGGVLFSASAAVTFTTVDMREMYQAMGHSNVEIEQMEQMGFSVKGMWLFMPVVMIPFFVFLLYVKRYFPK